MKKPLLLRHGIDGHHFSSVAAITVAAAASLTDAFKVIAADFERKTLKPRLTWIFKLLWDPVAAIAQ